MPLTTDCAICQEKTESETVIDNTFIGSPPILFSDLLLHCLGSSENVKKVIPEYINKVLCNLCVVSLFAFYEASQSVIVKRDEFISRINEKIRSPVPVEYYITVDYTNNATPSNELDEVEYINTIEDDHSETEVENSKSNDGLNTKNNVDEKFVEVNQPDRELEGYWSSESIVSTTKSTTLVRIKRTPRPILRYCWRCDKSFPSDDAFEVHLKLVHTKNIKVNFTCNKCKKCFGSKRERIAHTSSQQCFDGKQFKQSQNAVYDELTCSICWENMESDHSIQRHITMHHNVKKHRCPKCENTFSSKEYLKKHMNMHKQIQYFMCPVCDFKFRTAWNLKRHRKLHCLTDISRQPLK